MKLPWYTCKGGLTTNGVVFSFCFWYSISIMGIDNSPGPDIMNYIFMTQCQVLTKGQIIDCEHVSNQMLYKMSENRNGGYNIWVNGLDLILSQREP